MAKVTSRIFRAGAAAGAIVALCALILAPSSPAATEAPRCPPGSLELFAQAPDYVHPGVGIDVVLLAEGKAENVALTVSSSSGETRTPVALSGEKTPLILAGVPAPDPEAQLILEWDQNPGTATACHGRYSYWLPVLPSGTTAGERSLPRLSGRFQIKAPLRPTRGLKTLRPIWEFKPYCDYFACDVQVHSSRSLDTRMRLNGRGRYEVEFEYPPTEGCYADGGRGKLVAKKAYFSRERLELWVTRERDGQVLAFEGKRARVWEPTPRASRLGCVPSHEFEPLGGRPIEH